jgi:hypothetical protein
MNVNRILKEARPLFWPWCAVMAAGLFLLFRPPSAIASAGFLGLAGIPVLATLAFGEEFELRTFPLQLSQPIDRLAIWNEKITVSLLFVLPVVLVYGIALRLPPVRANLQGLGFYAAWIIASLASASFWTLMTRSLVGGVVLNIVVTSLISYTVNMASWLHHPAPNMPSNATGATTFSLFIYAALTLWLGRRALERFEVTGGAAGDDLLTAGGNAIPQTLGGWLRPRPTGQTLNLFRKEIRLLRPVWFITLAASIGWVCLVLMRLDHAGKSTEIFQIIVVSMAAISTLMIAILAGSLSLGEEKTSGTHAWQLTLPVPALLQWRVKLFMAMLAGFVGAWLLPVLITHNLSRPSDNFKGMDFSTLWLLVVLALTFAAFWCASAVDGTVAAVLWVIPVVCVLGCAVYFAQVLATGIVNPDWGPKPFEYLGSDAWLVYVSQSRQVLNLFGNLRFDWWVARITFRHIRVFSSPENPILYGAIAGGPALILALVQSYRLFRTRTSAGARLALRSLLPMVLLVFLCGFFFTALYTFWWRAALQLNHFNAVTGNAIEEAIPDAARPHPAGPLQLTVDDVAKAWRWPLEESTRHWLTGARITVTPDKAHPAGFFCMPGPYGHDRCYFSATIHLADGTDIFESYDPPTGDKFHWGRSSVYVRWPGAIRQEQLWDR